MSDIDMMEYYYDSDTLSDPESEMGSMSPSTSTSTLAEEVGRMGLQEECPKFVLKLGDLLERGDITGRRKPLKFVPNKPKLGSKNAIKEKDTSEGDLDKEFLNCNWWPISPSLDPPLDKKKHDEDKPTTSGRGGVDESKEMKTFQRLKGRYFECLVQPPRVQRPVKLLSLEDSISQIRIQGQKELGLDLQAKERDPRTFGHT